MTIKSEQIESHAGSFHHFVVPLPPGGRLLRVIPLRIVGSGFCPILSQRERRDGARRAPPFGGGRPRAMLAPDASVGKAENMCCQWICVSLNRLNYKLNLF